MANHQLIDFDASGEGTARLWATLEGAPGWEVVADLALASGTPVIAALTVCPRPPWGEVQLADGEVGHVPGDWSPENVPVGGLASRQLRRVNPGELLDLARGAARERADESTLHAHQFGRTERADLTASFSQAGDAADAFTAPRVRPGRRGHGSAFYAIWAARYAASVEDGSRRPHRDLAARYASEGYSEAAIRGIVSDARHRHQLLSPAVQGRPGGQLTDKAVTVLTERGRKKI